MVDRGFWRKAAEQGFVGFEAPGGLRRSRNQRFPLQRGDQRGGRLRRCGRRQLLAPERHHRPLPARAHHRRAEARWLPGLTTGDSVFAIAMTEPGAGSDLRAMKRQRPARRGRLRPRRLEDVRHQRDPGRPGDRRRPDRRGLQPARGRGGMEGFERGRKLDKVGRARPGHRGAVLQRRPRARTRTCSARRAGPALPDGAAARASGCRSRSPPSPPSEHALTITLDYVQRAPRLRPADRVLPAQPLHAGVAARQGPRRARVTSTPCILALNDGTAERRRRGGREGVHHRPAVRGARPLPPAARRLRLHERVRDLAAVARCPRAADLRGHQRGHARDRGPLARDSEGLTNQTIGW